MRELLYLTDPAVIKAAFHPLRQEILFHLDEGPRTATQLAEVLGTTAPRLSYHLKVLEKHGLIRLVEERRVGNLVEKYYQPVAKGFRIANEAGAPRPAIDALTGGLANSLRELVRTMGEEARLPKPDRRPIFGNLKTFRVTADSLAEFDELVAEARSHLVRAAEQHPGTPYQWAILLGPAPAKGVGAQGHRGKKGENDDEGAPPGP